MSNSQGTIETLAQELTKLLQPLKDDLSAGRARLLFAELGFAVTQAQVGTLSVPLQATTDQALLLVQKSRELAAAVEADDIAAIIQKGIEIIGIVKNVIDSFVGIRNGIDGLGLPGITPAMIAQIPGKLFNYLLVRYLDRLQGVTPVLSFMGILNQSEQNIGSTDPNQLPYTLSTFHFDQIVNCLSKPANQLKALYQWGDNAFDGRLLFARLEDILSRLAIPVIYDDTTGIPKLDLIIVEAIPKTDINPKGVVVKLKNDINTDYTISEDDFDLKFKIDFNPPFNTELLIQPNGNVSFTPPEATPLSGSVLFELTVKKKTNPEPYIILGETGGSRLEVLEFNLKSGSDLTWQSDSAKGDFFIEGAISGGKILIDTSGGDGFLQKILPQNGFESNFDIGFGVSAENGFYFQGSSALDIRLPMHLALGPIEINGLTLALKFKDGTIPVELGADIKAALGPLTVVVENIGIKSTFSFPPDNSGNLGPVQMDLGFKPPNGLGLSIDIGVFKGGGYLFFDFDKQEYAGALELEFQGILTLKVIGILTTKMPDGSPGFSLLLIITGEFPPIQLGFGFTLLGVGGLLGLNRTMIIEALRAGVKDNSIKSVLFPEDVIANITRIISDLKQIFPPYEGHFIVGPMAKIGWGTPTLISLELGLIIELPDPKIAILGVLKSALPDESLSILKLQVNFLGVIDFEAGEISFDASLFDSRLLIYTLTGDMALRIKWGGSPLFVLSVGGFHPDFKEIPTGLTNMRRLCISLYSGDNPRISVETYFAVTSSTVQFGAKAELYAAACGFNIYGYVGYDVLFRFSPFYFVAQICAGIALRRGTSELMGVHIRMQLSGPTPWNANGEATFSIFIFDFSISFNITWGDENTEGAPQLADVYAAFKDAITDNRNWKAEIPEGNTLNVTLNKIEMTDGEIVVHPFGILSVSQKVVPLDLEINKFGNQKPKDQTKFNIPEIRSGTIVLSTENEVEEFARANFIEMTDEQKLAVKSFETLKSGKKIVASNDLVSAMGVDRSVEYELSYLPKTESKKIRYLVRKDIFNQSVKGSAAALSTLSFERNKTSSNAPKEVRVEKEKFAVANKMDMRLHQPELIAGSEMEAKMMYDELLKNNPSLKNKIQVVSHFELSET